MYCLISFFYLFLTYNVSKLHVEAASQHIIIREIATNQPKIKLSDVKSLILSKDSKTTFRRTYASPQLKCVGGSAQCNYQPDIINCLNIGFDGLTVNWECKASLPKGMKFSKTIVICEGYENPTDAYILVGSCGLEYSIDSDSRLLQPTVAKTASTEKTNLQEENSDLNSKFKIGIIITIVIVVLILLFCCAVGVACFCKCLTCCGSSSSGKEQNYDYHPTPRAPSPVPYHPPGPYYQPVQPQQPNAPNYPAAEPEVPPPQRNDDISNDNEQSAFATTQLK